MTALVLTLGIGLSLIFLALWLRSERVFAAHGPADAAAGASWPEASAWTGGIAWGRRMIEAMREAPRRSAEAAEADRLAQGLAQARADLIARYEGSEPPLLGRGHRPFAFETVTGARRAARRLAGSVTILACDGLYFLVGGRLSDRALARAYLRCVYDLGIGAEAAPAATGPTQGLRPILRIAGRAPRRLRTTSSATSEATLSANRVKRPALAVVAGPDPAAPSAPADTAMTDDSVADVDGIAVADPVSVSSAGEAGGLRGLRGRLGRFGGPIGRPAHPQAGGRRTAAARRRKAA